MNIWDFAENLNAMSEDEAAYILERIDGIVDTAFTRAGPPSDPDRKHGRELMRMMFQLRANGGVLPVEQIRQEAEAALSQRE